MTKANCLAWMYAIRDPFQQNQLYFHRSFSFKEWLQLPLCDTKIEFRDLREPSRHVEVDYLLALGALQEVMECLFMDLP